MQGAIISRTRRAEDETHDASAVSFADPIPITTASMKAEMPYLLFGKKQKVSVYMRVVEDLSLIHI